jgi:hypothetical protein
MVLSIIFKSSIAYNKEKEGIAINNKIQHGIKVQIISNKVLCCFLLGIIQMLGKKFRFMVCLFKLKSQKTNSNIT